MDENEFNMFDPGDPLEPRAGDIAAWSPDVLADCHRSLRNLYDYWNTRRETRLMPARGDLDPIALKAVLPTLRGAATFQNLTGVYLYACAISALPLFVAACVHLMQTNPALSRLVRSFFFFLPFQDRPMRSIAFVLGVFVALFGFVVSVLAWLF